MPIWEFKDFADVIDNAHRIQPKYNRNVHIAVGKNRLYINGMGLPTGPASASGMIMMANHTDMYWANVSSFTGNTGTQGFQGQTGVQGVTGVYGHRGHTGFKGVTGLQGITGLQGLTGLVGVTGLQGIQGQTGVQGVQGLQGQTGIQGNTGLRGMTGIQGQTGVQGATGIQGVTGLIGQTGPQGQTGVAGTNGSQGQTGLQGLTGLQGIQGTTGLQGQTGLKGATGIQGTTGLQGQTGIQGTTGASITLSLTNTHVPYFNGTNLIDSVITTDGNYVAIAANTDATISTNTGDVSIFGANSAALTSNGDITINSQTNILTYGPLSLGYTGPSINPAFALVKDAGSNVVKHLSIATLGQTGIQGVTGIQGQTGIKGVTGLQGQTGIQGTTGAAPVVSAAACTVDGAAWKRVAVFTGGTVADGRRGYAEIELNTIGGTYSTHRLNIKCFVGWSVSQNNLDIRTDSIQFWDGVRTTYDATYKYLEVHFVGAIANNLVIELKDDGYNNAVTPYSGALTTGGDTVIETKTLYGDVQTIDGELDVSGNTIKIGADASATTRTDSTLKSGKIALYHYTNADTPACIINAFSNNISNAILIGGGTSSLNAATELYFYTAADNSTTTGTLRMSIVADGTVSIKTCADAGTDTDKILVLDSNDHIHHRTGTELASDIGAVTGTGTTNKVIKYTNGANGVIGDSSISDTGTYVTIPTVLDLDRTTQTLSGSNGIIDEEAVNIFEVSIPSNDHFGGTFTYTIRVIDTSNELQIKVGSVYFGAVNKAGTITSYIAPIFTGSTIASTGTLTATFSIVNGASKVTVYANANTNLTDFSEFAIIYEVKIQSDQGTCVVTRL